LIRKEQESFLYKQGQVLPPKIHQKKMVYGWMLLGKGMERICKNLENLAPYPNPFSKLHPSTTVVVQRYVTIVAITKFRAVFNRKNSWHVSFAS